MKIEPIFEKIKFNCEKKQFHQQIRLDCKSDVAVEDISSVLSVTAWAVVSESDISGGQIRYGGKAIFYICYLDKDGVIKKCECGNEFKGVITEQAFSDDAKLFVTASVDKTDFDLAGARLCVGAYTTICAKITECVEGQALLGGDNLIVNENELSCIKSCGVKKGVYPIEEEFELSYPVSQVLCHRAQAVLTAVQSGVGVIIVDGEVLLSAIMLQKNDKNDIIKENKTLPFRFEIECEDAMPNMKAVARVKERSHKIDLTVDEDNGKSLLNVSVSICLEGEAFYEQNVSVASDVFSTEQELEFSKDEFSYWLFGEMSCCSSNLLQRASVDELPIGAVILAVGNETIEGLTVQSNGSKAVANGVLSSTLYFRDGEGIVFCKRVETAFECELSCLILDGQKLDVVARVRNSRARIVSLMEVELEAELCFNLYSENKNQVKLISQIKACGEKKRNTCALSVYIPCEGEELWSLAKRLNVCPKSLVETNADLLFPLTGKERIVVYRQK